MIELYLWRHKIHTDIYLVRNANVCGGWEESDFYGATKSIVDAIKSVLDPEFEKWMYSFVDDDGNSKLKVKITDSKTVDIDGYTGNISKILTLEVKDFEKIKLVEVQDE